jgi:dihydroflavonol-4-reductase
MRILVTGATGFIGSKLVPALIEQGHEVRTFGRTKNERLSQLGAEHFTGDVTDFQAVSNAVASCQLVFHLAGLVSYRKADTDKQYAVNVVGTTNVMQACLDNGVQRVIHTSSIAGMGIPEPGTVGDENIKYNLEGRGLNYCDSKYQSEKVVLRFAGEGLPALILSPGIIFGEGDTHPHHKAIFLAMSKGWLVGWPPGGVTFCDIDDVVQAHINAMTKGRVGERYVLGSANLTFREAAGVLSRTLGGKPPAFEIPGWVLEGIGSFCEAIFPMLGRSPALTKQVAWLSQQEIFFSNRKSIDELGVAATPFEQTVKRTAPYYLTMMP